jgi:hypothetical protein
MKEVGKVVAPVAPELRINQTPETYVGSYRATRYLKTGSELPADYWRTTGDWTIEGEKLISAAAGAGLQFHFKAQKVFLVMGTVSGEAIQVKISLNGHPAGVITVDRHTLYQLIDQHSFKEGLLEIKVDEPGLELYAFTFG